MIPENRTQLARPSFEAALMGVAHCLTEAEAWEERGSPLYAGHLMHLAEVYALRTGYVELLRLVWTYHQSDEHNAAPPA
ncbi:MAG: hypothetical protein H7Z41_17925 [Cytophagales bacterium]|nr:hypothetical protein [Armatimonadota bacterium]